MNQAAIQQQPTGMPDLDSYTDMNVGEILRRTREHYGQTLEQVELNLRIRASQLFALENLQLDQLPGRVYSIGFVRAYSEYLGLDGDKMVHLFKAQSVGKRAKPDLQFPVTYMENKSPNAAIILISAAAVVLIIAYLSVFHTPTNYVEAVPPVPEMLKQSTLAMAHPVVEEPAESLLQPAAPAKAKAENKASHRMELVVSEDSWVEIKNAEGQIVVREVLNPGDKYIVPEDQKMTLSTGNAGGITVFVDGKRVRTLGKSTQVRRNIALDPESFKAN